jgi:hypothetical protein
MISQRGHRLPLKGHSPEERALPATEILCCMGALYASAMGVVSDEHRD